VLESKPDKNRVMLAMVALNSPSMPPAGALTASLRAVPGIDLDLGSVKEAEGNVVFGLGKDNAAAALMHTPIPWTALEGPCATAWWWPEATEKMKDHTSHILVALAGETGKLVQRHVTLTHVTAAVAAHTDAAGIYWGGGTLVHEPQAFIEQARELSPDNLPWPLWIDFRVEGNEDGSCRLFTTGMKAFDKLEMEIPHSRHEPAEVFDFACSIADYVITTNPRIEDGHTVGRTETEKIRAEHAPSMWDPTTTVLRLDF
jgi:hypothetical protein